MNANDVLWSVDDLIARCADDDPRVRAWAVERLGMLRAAAALPALLRALEDTDPRVLVSAIKAVDALGDAAPLDALREPLRGLARNGALPPGPRGRAQELLLLKRDPEGIEAVADRCRRGGVGSEDYCRLLAKHAPERLRALAAELKLLARPGRGPASVVAVLPRVISLDELPAAYAALRSMAGAADRERLAGEFLRRALADAPFVHGPASSDGFEAILSERSATFIYDSAEAHVERWLSPPAFAPLLDATAGARWREAIAWCAAWCAAVADDDPEGGWGRALLGLLAAETRPDEFHARVAAALAMAAGERAIERELPFEACSVEEQFARACDAPDRLSEARCATVEARWLALPEGGAGREAVAEQLENIQSVRDAAALVRAVELAARLPGLALSPRLIAEVPDLGSDFAAALTDCLAAQPAALRALAPEALAAADADVRRVVLEALGRQNGRWAGAWLAEHFDELLAHESAEAVFYAVKMHGDPSLLPRVIAAWRPGEQLAAATAARLARLGGLESTLPPGLLRDADQANAGQDEILSKMLSTGGFDGLIAMIGDKPLSVELVCNRCKRSAHYETGTASVHPDLERCKRDGWDGVVFERIITCKYCGAEDDYTIGPMAMLSIMAGPLGAVLQGRPLRPDDLLNDRMRIAVPTLSDGTHIRRASEALRHWEKKLARDPGDADAWLRLGNLQRSQPRVDAAIESYRRSIALRPTHVETLGALLETLLEAGRADEGSDLPGAILAALPGSGATNEVRVMVATLVAEFVRLAVGCGQALGLMASWPGADTKSLVVMNVSTIDLRRVTRWDRLTVFIAHPSVLMMSLKSAAPDDVDSQLEQMIESDRPLRLDGGRGAGAMGLASAGAKATPVRAAPKIGRNDPCHCGSGKKYKKCHGG